MGYSYYEYKYNFFQYSPVLSTEKILCTHTYTQVLNLQYSRPQDLAYNVTTYPGQVLDLVRVDKELFQGALEVEHLARHVVQAAVAVVKHSHIFLLDLRPQAWALLHKQCHNSTCNILQCHNLTCNILQCHYLTYNISQCHNLTSNILQCHNSTCNISQCHNSTCNILQCHNSTCNILKCHNSTCNISQCHNSTCNILQCHNSICNISQCHNSTCNINTLSLFNLQHFTVP